MEVDLYPYNGGSRSQDDRFKLFGNLEVPQLPITAITDTDKTLLLGSLPLGKFIFELMPDPLPGDFNENGDVEGADFLRWQRGESPFPLTWTDRLNFEQYYGTSVGSLAATAAVPEPHNLMLVVVALMGISTNRPRYARITS